MRQEPVDGGADQTRAKPSALVFAKEIDLVQAGCPLRVVRRRMTPDEADQLFCRCFKHENEMRGVDFQKLFTPLPFASCIGGSRSEWSKVRLFERANMELCERAKIGDSGLA